MTLVSTYAAVAIAHFISVKVTGIDAATRIRPFATVRQFTLIPMVASKMIIHVTIEVFIAMEPGADTDEDSIIKPFGAVVSSRSTIVRCCLVVTIWTVGCRTDFDTDLRLCLWCSYQQTSRSSGR